MPEVALDLLPEPEAFIAREKPIEPEPRGNPWEIAALPARDVAATTISGKTE